MLLEALNQQGSENAVHIPFILCFRRFIVFLKQRAKFNKNLLTRQGKKNIYSATFFRRRAHPYTFSEFLHRIKAGLEGFLIKTALR